METEIKTEADDDIVTEIECMVPTHTIERIHIDQLTQPANTLEESLSDEVIQPRNKKIWTSNETKQLMSLYDSLIGEVGNRFPYIKDMWEEIAAYFPNKTSQQCMNRHSTMLRKTRRRLRKVYLLENSKNMLKLDSVQNKEMLQVPGIGPIRNVQYWTDSETQKLIDLYNDLINDVGMYRRFPRKRDIWKEIAKHFPHKSPKACQNRINRVLYKPQNGVIKYIKTNASDVFRRKLKSKMKYNSSSSSTLKISKVQTLEDNTFKDDSETETCSLVDENTSELEDDISEEEFIQITDDGVVQNDVLMHESRFEEENVTNLQNNEDVNTQHSIHIIQAIEDKQHQKDINMTESNFEIENKNNFKDNELNIDNNGQTIESVNNVLPNDTNEQELRSEGTKFNYKDLNTSGKSIQETLWEIAAKKEESKERRHKEKLQAIKELAIILDKIYHKIDK